MQTIGRAARHLYGTAILYADSMTRSMKAAIRETERRRKKQTAFNQAHNITPTSIQHGVADIMEGAYDTGKRHKRGRRRARQPEKPPADELLDARTALQRIAKAEKKMYQHASDLEFEEAARLRDEIKRIRERAFVKS